MHEACPPHSSAGIVVANMKASSVAQYLAALPADRRAALSAVRKAIWARVCWRVVCMMKLAPDAPPILTCNKSYVKPA